VTVTTPLSGWRGRIILATLALAGVVAALVQTLVLPLLPLFPQWLGISVADAQWIATSTMLAGAIGAPLFGWLGDRFGLARMIVLSLVLLSVGSVVAALADTLSVMLIGRVLQGLSAGIVGLALALARTTLAPGALPWAVGVVSGTLGVGTGLGVPLAGVLLETLPWQSVFWIAAALGAVSAALVALLVPHRPSRSTKKFDIVGAVVFSGILLATLIPLSTLGTAGVTAGGVVSWAVAALASVWWVRHELRTSSPFVDVRFARRRPIVSSHVSALLIGAAFFLSFTGTVYVVQTPTVDGVGLGGSVLLTGVVQTPASIASIAAAPLATFIATRWGARRTVTAGAFAVAIASLARLPVLDDPVVVAVCALLVSGSASFTFAAMPLVLMDAAPVHATGTVNGLNIMMRQIGSASAGVIAAVVLAATADAAAPSRDTFTWLFGLGAVCGLLAGIALLPWRRRAQRLISSPSPSPAPERTPR